MRNKTDIKLPDAAHCMECNNCVVSCTHGAIRLKYDFWGRAYPSIDKNACVGCRLCERNCPENGISDLKLTPYKKCYAVIANKDILEESSSGGFATVLSNYILKQGGIVVGATFSKFPICNHVIVDKEEDLPKLQKSKYIYSHLNTVLPEIRSIAKENPSRTIVFFGVPCQIAAAKRYLNKASNIVYVEILCHGTMPDFIFPKYIKGIENKYNIKATDFLFRGDKKSSDYLVFQKPQVVDSDNKQIGLAKWNKWYLVSFLEGYTYKTKCYHCNYTGTKRLGDIIIGDFWGLGKDNIFEHSQNEGVSLVLLNTDAGINTFSAIKHLFDVAEERPLTESIMQNQTLTSPTIEPIGNTLYHLALRILPWSTLLSFHKIRFYWLKCFRAAKWRIRRYILRLE